jgi:hypothetical protein
MYNSKVFSEEFSAMNIMKNIQKKIVSVFVMLLIAFSVSMPLKASATVPPLMSFGGLVTFSIPCICTASFWTWYTPLFLTAAPITGPMAYVPYATLLFLNFTPPIIPLTPSEGAYIPGVQMCWQYIGIACIPMPVIGMMGFVGTGLPGGI